MHVYACYVGGPLTASRSLVLGAVRLGYAYSSHPCPHTGWFENRRPCYIGDYLNIVRARDSWVQIQSTEHQTSSAQVNMAVH